jgi:DNA-binding transcriptional regulator YdaS (Cro superfamily)
MNLRDFLKDKDREQFAELIGMSAGYLAQVAVGIRRPSPDLAAKISAASGGMVSIEDLLYPEGLPPDAKLVSNGN